MGVVKEQKKHIENLERRVDYWKRMSNNRVERALRAEAKLAAAEKMLTILVKRMGGRVEISDNEWTEEMKVFAKRNDEANTTEYIYVE